VRLLRDALLECAIIDTMGKHSGEELVSVILV
jgi:hypothetical protein